MKKLTRRVTEQYGVEMTVEELCDILTSGAKGSFALNIDVDDEHCYGDGNTFTYIDGKIRITECKED